MYPDCKTTLKHVLIPSTKWWQERFSIAEHTFYSVNLVNDFSQGEGTQYKRPYGDVPPTWVAKSASWYMNDPLFNTKFCI